MLDLQVWRVEFMGTWKQVVDFKLRKNRRDGEFFAIRAMRNIGFDGICYRFKIEENFEVRTVVMALVGPSARGLVRAHNSTFLISVPLSPTILITFNRRTTGRYCR